MMYGLDGAIPGRVDSTFCVLFAFDVMYSVLQVTISRGGGDNKPFIIRRTQIWQIRHEREGAGGGISPTRLAFRRYAKKADS